MTMLMSSRLQRLGDLAADTLVIHDQGGRHTTLEQTDATTEAPDWSLDRNDQLVLLAFSERAGQLSEARRRELAGLAYPELPAEAASERLVRVAGHVQGTGRSAS